MQLNSYSFSSQQIRNYIKSGKILVPDFDEDRVQPSSFEPTLSDEVYVLDMEHNGLFRVNKEETIYENLLKLPGRCRKRVDISNGFELKKGFSYLIPLKESVKLETDEYLKSSPKSSLGRLFLNTRLLGDYNPCFDEINSNYARGKEIKLWLFVQSLAFNVIVHPGVTLNQLRFFKGYQAQMTPVELIEELKNNPILFRKNQDGRDEPVEGLVTDGVEMHLNLSGQTTEGIIGLRARHNPDAIDLSKIKHYEAEDFFEPIKGKDNILIKREEYYLLASEEILKIPAHLSIEVRDYSHIGLIGPLHFAGFIDNGFEGDLVFEIRSDELSKAVELSHGMPVSKLDVFKTEIPDKLYGTESGSNYKGQVGPKAAKYFKSFDYAYAARNYKLLDRMVLTQNRSVLLKHRRKETGFEYIDEANKQALVDDIANGFMHYRYDCETDDLLLQPSPYLIIFGPNETVFTYVRAQDMQYYPEERLFGKHSIGLGGHLMPGDAPNYINNCIRREIMEKNLEIDWEAEPRLIGTVMAIDAPVDNYHMGLIMVAVVRKIRSDNKVIDAWELAPISEINNRHEQFENFESWSKKLMPHLTEIYGRCKK